MPADANNAVVREPLIVWRFVDGKPGHENQTLGLSNALAALMPVEVHEVPVHGGWKDGWRWLSGGCSQGADLPDPGLLIGAGHATHLAMLACRRVRGGRAVVLMRPSLPSRWFDLCVIPEHDGVSASPHVLLSRGVLNPLRPGAEKDAAQGLLLVGGPSAHYGWDESVLREQIVCIAREDARHWTVATSRRTPGSTAAALKEMDLANVTVVPWEEAEPGWLAGRMASASVVWITEDSVSMLYEALTAGAACGVLPVPVVRDGRVRAGVMSLIEDGTVVSYAAWQQGRALEIPAEPLDEATRTAQWIREQWFVA